MSTTLTNGLKLPDKGSVDWYADMQNNYAILDGAVGTVAEHTSQIAGKAPAVHTHTKSDITDLLNSNFIPSANNSYDLGSSSYQWNNLYAKNYYYNGVAWGLDKYNTWTSSQVYKLTGTEVGSTTSGYISLSFTDKNNNNLGFQRTSVYSDGRTCFSWKIYNTDNNSQAISSSLEYYITKTEVKVFTPVENGEVNLGTSNTKWKTLNGINPGALSLPDMVHGIIVDTTNWIVNPSTNNGYTPSQSGWLNVVVTDSLSSGEFSIYIKSTNFFVSAVHKLGDIDDNNNKVGLFIPVTASITYYVVVKGNVPNATISATLYPCQGNV